MQLDYIDVIKQAWQIIWKHKWLWLFGFIAALGSGGGNFSNSLQYSSNSGNTSSAGANVSQFMSTYLVVIILLALLFLVIGLVLMVFSIIANGALIGSAIGADAGETVGLGIGWRVGLKYFWRLLGLNLLIGLVVLVLVAIPVAIGVLAALIGGSGSSLTPALFCLIPIALIYLLAFIVFVILLGISANYAMRYIVIDGAGVIDGLKKGFALFRLRWADTVLMYLLLGVIGFGVGVVLLIPGAAIGLPAIAMGITGVALKSIILVAAGVFVGMLAILVMAVLNGVFVAFSSVAWTLTYLRLTSSEDKPAS
jgi:hypothetical protein